MDSLEMKDFDDLSKKKQLLFLFGISSMIWVPLVSFLYTWGYTW